MTEGSALAGAPPIITTIHCTDLPFDFTEREFHNMFILVDGFEQASLVANNKGNKLMGFARFTTPQQASLAVLALHNRIIDPATKAVIKVTMAQKQMVPNTRPPTAKRPLDELAPATSIAKIQRHSPSSSHSYSGITSSAASSVLHSIGLGGGQDTLHISGLDSTTSEAEMQVVAQSLPGFRQMKFVTRSDGRAFCLMQFVDEAHATQALALNGSVLPSGRQLSATFSKSPLGVPKRGREI